MNKVTGGKILFSNYLIIRTKSLSIQCFKNMLPCAYIILK